MKPLAPQPLAVDLTTAASMLGVSQRQLQVHMRRGDVVARYSGTKPIFPVTELMAFLMALPEEPRAL